MVFLWLEVLLILKPIGRGRVGQPVIEHTCEHELRKNMVISDIESSEKTKVYEGSKTTIY